jgi:NADPH:quinone reductase-like Zn-dependent oxidoreductase
MDSRSLDFADHIKATTGGRGVDLILNSLAGEAIPKGLSVLADHGRFIEIGKTDIYKNSKLGLQAFRKNISLMAVDLVAALSEKAGELADEFHQVIERVRQRELSALPHRIFPLDRIGDAFRYMSQGKHTGKVVVSFRGGPRQLAPALERPPLVRAEGTYLITGGLGGFGLATASWLVEQGARHLVLMGRSGATGAEAQQVVAKLQDAGVQVLVAQGDVSRRDDVARILAEIEPAMPPLRGVIHAAMVLDDCLVENLTPERWLTVMRPKAIGAWNLHCLTSDRPLDFFV